jgi:MFS family permease
MLFHPLFNSRAFERVTDDGFFISVEAWDPKFSALETERFLRQIGATHVELVQRAAVEPPVARGPGSVSHGSAASPDLLARQGGASLARLAWLGGALGIGGLVASLVLGAAQMRHFYFSWLVAFLYFLSIALGSLFFILVLFVCRAGWSVALRRVVENVIATVPVFALLFVPIWLGRHELFVWTDAADVAKNRVLQGQQPFLNDSFFLIRALIYFVSWSALAVYFSRQSQKQDGSRDERITRRLQTIAAPGIVLFALTLTFAAIDWILSLDPEWYSTMIGVYYFSGALLASFAFLIVAITAIQARGPLRGVVTIEHVHDVGKLLFGFTVFWAYIAFSQYFLIWYANIPEETAYYIERATAPGRPSARSSSSGTLRCRSSSSCRAPSSVRCRCWWRRRSGCSRCTTSISTGV